MPGISVNGTEQAEPQQTTTVSDKLGFRLQKYATLMVQFIHFLHLCPVSHAEANPKWLTLFCSPPFYPHTSQG